jgi:hypothetical protein
MRQNMMRNCIQLLTVTIASLVVFAGCSSIASPQSTPSGPGSGTIINSDSIVTGKIIAKKSSSTGYPWAIDIQVLSSQDVNNLPNPTKDKIGQTITCYTSEDAGSLQVGQSITAHVKYVGDVPRPGIVLYISDIRSL